MHPLKTNFDHKLTEKLDLEGPLGILSSNNKLKLSTFFVILSNFDSKFLSQFMVKIRFQLVNWKAELLSLNMHFELDFR